MSPEFVIDIARKAIQTTLMIAAPMLLSGMIIGLLVSIFQAATQINEQTMTFIPKIVVVFLSLLIFAPWIMHTMIAFTMGIFESLASF
ncbi:MAG: flagellar biosynthesis protein FliQ [Proteobacteria bacterium]|jgi:flagellar biosynthetic protein FliQ|nr:flagellar biosynthesis protein FliQ [Desulfocapsa sp.]MBU3943817.1 flagellar biosynthesis protein FliQ [Pseudomonadota bacterium]MCG2743686.1 flagellar biosynthesis protein FliQ [Desulfobacteraceae bacterium]MBU3983227.1 flagellar biosynthesis protein FliQ [Pseudomonadota bacterium]MBU4082984.1 flagellar biosynthesis protein FliQ [Pseudomonadota bacterium]